MSRIHLKFILVSEGPVKGTFYARAADATDPGFRPNGMAFVLAGRHIIIFGDSIYEGSWFSRDPSHGEIRVRFEGGRGGLPIIAAGVFMHPQMQELLNLLNKN